LHRACGGETTTAQSLKSFLLLFFKKEAFSSALDGAMNRPK
jgi:hypothetical protein